jgi:parallel beta-helix repeat protein
MVPANTVPAVLVGRDGALWVGSALGLSRLQDGRATRVPFAPELSFRGNPATLEAFFQAVAQALFSAQPVTAVRVGGVSFVEAFGSPLVKEDLIFSLAEDGQSRLWVGTLGGGLRRVELRNGVPQDTLHLTRADGLASNLIFALAVAPDGAIWAATDEGVSRLVEGPGGVSITTLSVLDSLPVPARDLAVDAAGTVWVATDGGLVRIGAVGGVVTGMVQDTAGTPVAGADVLLQGTPLRAVTDAQGRFSMAQVPPGAQRLRVDGTLASVGPLTLAVQEVVVTAGSQTQVLVRLGTPVPFDPQQGGLVIFPAVPGAVLEVPPGATTLSPDTAPVLGLTTLPLAALPQPLPPGFTPVAAAEFAPDGLHFSRPARLTLPLATPLPAGQLGILLHFNVATQTYAQVGLGRVSADGTRITSISGGLTQLSTVLFATTAAQATKVFLVPVAGNNQRVQPGEVLPEPLVVRLEDQFGNPVAGEAVAARITRGEGRVIAADATTDAQGEARVRVQAGASGTDLVVAVEVPALPEVRPAQFFAVIGAFDTPGDALDLMVAGDVVFIADVSNGGLQVLDVQDPTHPAHLHTLLNLGNSGFPTFPTSVARNGNRLYVGTFVPEHLYVLDISHPRAPDFAADRDGNGVPDVVLGSVALPADLGARAIAFVGRVLYAVTANSTPGGVATLHVVDVAQDTRPRLLSTVDLPVPDPTGLAVAADVAYVGARAAGVLVFDVHEPSAPRLVGSVGDPDPSDTIAVSVVAGPGVAGQFAYLLETQREQQTGRVTEHFVVLDLHNPLAPVRRGTALLHGVTNESVLTIVGTRLAVAGSFAYVTRGALGLQAVDISQPDAPRPVGVITTPSYTQTVAAADQVLYVTDAIFGLQVVRGPGPNEPDTDGDGIIDFFDAFPTDPTEWQDTDGDRVGDNADPDSDNDGFTDAEEAAATPPTDPLDPRLYPVTAPPPGVTTLIVDAASPASVRARNGTPEAPYRSPTEALQVLRNGQVPQVRTLFLRAGLYAPSTTHDAFPLDLSGLAHLTLRGEDRATTVLDAEFRNSVVVAGGSQDLVFEDLTITHGWLGLAVFFSRDIVIQRIDSNDHNRHGLVVAATTGAVLEDNLVASSRAISGIGVALGAEAVLTRNVSRAHPLHGIGVFAGSRVDMRDNVFEDNGLSGIVIDLNVRATLTNNLTQGNALDGLTLSRNVSATLTNNVIQDNGRDGIAIVDTSQATISGGTISQNSRDGVRVGSGASQPGRSTAAIGLDGAVLLELSLNGGTGLLVVNDGFGSVARIDSLQIVFKGNTAGDVAGNVCDVAAGPC